MLTMYKWNNPALKQIWQNLYADNSYLFPYSSWEYNEQIYKYMKVKPSSMFQKNYFLVYEEEKKPLVLFPLYLISYVFLEKILVVPVILIYYMMNQSRPSNLRMLLLN